MRKHDFIKENLKVLDAMQRSGLSPKNIIEKFIAYESYYDLIIKKDIPCMQAYEIVAKDVFDSKYTGQTIRGWISELNQKISIKNH